MYWNKLCVKQQYTCTWLTLTWDVLKFASVAMPATLASGLTLTWDVLKY